jgi:Dyp-type peroxidase family
MVSPKTQLGDRVKNGVKVDWEDVYRSHDIHAMILLAHDSHQQLYKQVQEITQEIKSNGIKIVQMELGCTRKNHKNQPVEPFGFPDGISQPLFFTEDINEEKGKNWDPSAGLDLVLNVDPFGKKFCDVYDKQNASQNSKSYSFGSFLVYRKLEQDVKSFNEKVKRIATCKLDDSTGSLEEREAIVRAFVVGRRKEDGCPVYVHDPNKSLFVDSNVSVNLNDFNYGADEEFQHDSAFKCPFNAHIRRMNPRGIQGKNQQSGYVYSGKSIYENSPEGQRNARIVRRGVSYGLPKDISYLSQETQDNLEAYKSLIENLINLGRELEIPIKGDKEGILFLCFQGSIDDQFDVLQKRYANTIDLGPFGGLNEQDPNRKSPVFGVDPLIGREDTDETNMSLTHSWWPKEWGNLNAGEIKFETLEETKFSDYVIPRGGEYFFTPSISFLKSLKEE